MYDFLKCFSKNLEKGSIKIIINYLTKELKMLIIRTEEKLKRELEDKEFQEIIKKRDEEFELYKTESLKDWSEYYVGIQNEADILLNKLITYRKRKNGQHGENNTGK